MKSISSRLLLEMLAIAVVGMGLIAAIGIILAGNALNKQSLSRIDEATTSQTEFMDAWIEHHIGYIEAIAADFSSIPDVSPEALLPDLIGHISNNVDFFAVYVGYTDGSAVFSDEWVPDNGWIATERDWYRGAANNPNATFITDVYADADTQNLCVTISRAFMHNGSMAGVVAIDIFSTVLSDIADNVNVGPESYAFLTDSQGNIITHHNIKYEPVIDSDGEAAFQNIASVENNLFADLRDSGMISGGSSQLRDENGVMCYYSARVIPSNNWILYTVIPMSVVNAAITQQITVSVIVFLTVLCAAAFLIHFSLKRLITRPVNDMANAAGLLANGETGVHLDGSYTGEIALLADSFLGMESFNMQQAQWLERIATGDLSIEVSPRGDNDRIGHAIFDMLKKLNDMFAHINQNTNQVSDGSKQIASGAKALAQGSTQQASSIEELSGSIARIAEKTKANANKAEKAAKLAETIRDNAGEGSNQMDEMIAAVKGIHNASQSIIKVIKVIDDIAFQTNILALNAAVEAARAGQHGKGFAVVAEEVRNLAAKSAEAAKETGDMIQNSIEKAELGFHIAGETGESLLKIVSGINESNQLVIEIAKASEEQSSGIEQINTGINQVAQIVSQNSTTAQESAAASEEMSYQASSLQELISQFKFRSGERRSLHPHV